MRKPTGARLLHETLSRSGHSGDNFWTTWGPDGHQYVTQDDGSGWEPDDRYQNRVWRIRGETDDFSADYLPGYPHFPLDLSRKYHGSYHIGYGYYAYGIVSVDGVLYVFLSKTPTTRWGGPFQGCRLIASDDLGESWSNVAPDGTWQSPSGETWDAIVHPERDMFFYRENERFAHGGWAYPFTCNAFAQCGQDYQAAHDEYVYVYSVEGTASNELLLARAPRARLGQRATWEFCSGVSSDLPTWSARLADRQPIHRFPDRTGADYFSWYSWLPSVVYNSGLGVFVMATHGTYTHSLRADTYHDARVHTKTGSLMLLWAEHPWGPWKQLYYEPYWIADDYRNKTYQTTLSQKWISDDGTRMVLIWSDAAADETGRSHQLHYRWNQMEIELQL